MPQRSVLESDALGSFAVFAQHRNFTRAAAALHISQPSLHAKIGRLSRALDAVLYERAGRHLVLTEVGEQLAAFASDMAKNVDDFLKNLDSGTASRRVVLAAGRGAIRWVVADAIRAGLEAGWQIRL